jgi:hypothetical protein
VLLTYILFIYFEAVTFILFISLFYLLKCLPTNSATMKALADRDEEFEVFVVFPFFSFPMHAKIWKCVEFSGSGKKDHELVLSTSF